MLARCRYCCCCCCTPHGSCAYPTSAMAEREREREAGTGVVRPAGWLADLRRTTPELDRLGNDKQSQLSSPDPRALHAYRCRELYERLKVAASSNRRTITAEISADFPRCRSPIMRLLSNGHTVAIAVPAECKLIKIGQVFAPGAARRYAPAAHRSSTCGGSTSARSSLVAGQLQAASVPIS